MFADGKPARTTEKPEFQGGTAESTRGTCTEIRFRSHCEGKPWEKLESKVNVSR